MSTRRMMPALYRGGLPLLVLLAVGCDGGVIDPGEDPPADDPCSQAWDDVEVDLHDGCAAADVPEQWDLVQTWSWGQEYACSTVHAGPILDVDGDGAGDTDQPMQVWMQSKGPDGMDLYEALVDLGGTVHATVEHEARGSYGTIADVEPDLPGMEYVVSYSPEGADVDEIALYSGEDRIWQLALPQEAAAPPWITDLEGDGAAEVIALPYVLDAVTGQIVFEVEDAPGGRMSWPIAADLDLDGRREIISATTNGQQEIRYYDSEGALRSTCWHGEWNWAVTAFAVADVDDDPELEVVAATTGYLVVCDTDGTVLAEVSIDAGQPGLVGVGQLDQDPAVEFVVADYNGITAVDDDFSLLWQTSVLSDQHGMGHSPMTLADLDGDGRHEVIVRVWETLAVLDGDGVELARLSNAECNCSYWIGAPAVVDVDADGLAEIVVPAWPDVAVVENPLGGWDVAGADEPWANIDKFPGDRTLDGQVTGPADEPWTDPSTNVWQGLPAASAEIDVWADLSGEIVDVCEHEGTATVTAYVNNHGPDDTDADVVVVLRSSDGVDLGQATLPAGLPTATGRAVGIEIAAADAVDTLELIVDEGGAIPECDEGNNHATWTEE